MSDVKYIHFLNSDSYPLYIYCLQDYKKTLIDKMLMAEDKDKVWEYKQAIKSLDRFQQFIEYMANNKAEEQ